MSKEKKIMRCSTHGRVEWKGTIMCAACGRVSQALDSKQPHFTPVDCPCGAVLMANIQDDDGTGNFVKPRFSKDEEERRKKVATARAICGACFRAKVKQQTESAPS